MAVVRRWRLSRRQPRPRSKPRALLLHRFDAAIFADHAPLRATGRLALDALTILALALRARKTPILATLARQLHALPFIRLRALELPVFVVHRDGARLLVAVGVVPDLVGSAAGQTREANYRNDNNRGGGKQAERWQAGHRRYLVFDADCSVFRHL